MATASVDPNKIEEKVLIRWMSEERPFKARSREFYSTVLVLAILVAVIFFFIEGLMPVLLIGAIVFMVFAVSRTVPGQSEHVITDRGIYTGGQLYRFEEMRQFWFDSRWGKELVHVLISRWPGQLILVLPSDPKVTVGTLKQILGKYLTLEKPADTWLDKTTSWLNKKIPLDEV